MPKLVRAVSWLIAGYVVGAATGALLVALLSANTHDKSLETVMTAAFVTGPLGALVGVVTALMRRPRP